MNLFTLWGLSSQSKAPSINSPTLLTELHELGFEAVQGLSAVGAREAGLQAYGVAQVHNPDEFDRLANEQQAAGFRATNVIAGSGLETDADRDRYCDSLLKASVKYGYPIYLETHRGSITQDIRRTLDAISRFPELRFTADFSHWYVGNDLSSGDFSSKLAVLTPLLERVRFVQGRLSSPTRVQVALEGLEDKRYFVEHYRTMLQACFGAFLSASSAEERIPFAPELLPATIVYNGATIPLDYAYTERAPSGEEVETSDRWQQALWLMKIAEQAFELASAQARFNDPATSNP